MRRGRRKGVLPGHLLGPDPIKRLPEFYDTPGGTGIYKISYKPPWTTKFGWQYRTRMAASMIWPGDDIFDLGCGMGVLPAMLHHLFGFCGNYIGWDFSSGAIDHARNGNNKDGYKEARFEVENFGDDDGRRKVSEFIAKISGNSQKMGRRRVVTICEVLEHLEHDVELVEAVPVGTPLVVTVPQYWAESHLRRFPTFEDVVTRYGHLLDVHHRRFQFYPGHEVGHFLLWGHRR